MRQPRAAPVEVAGNHHPGPVGSKRDDVNAPALSDILLDLAERKGGEARAIHDLLAGDDHPIALRREAEFVDVLVVIRERCQRVLKQDRGFEVLHASAYPHMARLGQAQTECE